MGTSMYLNRVNINGIPCIESTSVTVSTTAVTFNFNPHVFANERFSGLIAVRIDDTFEAPTEAVPIYFNVNGVAGSLIGLTKVGGASVTSAEFTNTGIYLVFYDRFNSVMQVVSPLS